METPETIECVFSFLYLGKYRDDGHIAEFQPGATDSFKSSVDEIGSGNSQDASTDLENPKEIALNNVGVFVAADKFGISSLTSLATHKFRQHLDARWKSPLFSQIIRESIELLPAHEHDLEEVMAEVISEHLLDLVKHRGNLCLLDSFGTRVILRLVSSGSIKRPFEDDQLQAVSQK
jgi:hypothetical protein